MKKRALITPVLGWLGIFLVLPLISVLVVSFSQRDEYGHLIFQFTLSNYTHFFEPLYLKIYWETLVLSIMTTGICLLLSYPLAYYIAHLNAGARRVWLILITIPFWINFLIRTYAWVLLLRNQGIINGCLLKMGWIQEPLSLLYTKQAVLLGMVYTLIPFMVLPIYVALEQMDHRLTEAAQDLGATRMKVFWHITLPQTKSGILTGSVLVFITTTGMFMVTDILGGAKATMLSNIIQNQFLGARNWPFGAALSIIFVFSSLIILQGLNRAFTFRYERVKQEEGKL